LLSDLEAVRSLFDRWERVWHHGETGLIQGCLCTQYIRHDDFGDRTVAWDDYAAELAVLKRARPDVRILVYDHLFETDHAWFRFTMRWTDQESGTVSTRAGFQSYRIENGKLAETWVVFRPLGSAWEDPTYQPNWTTPRPGP
jgi:hypothetical protein